MKLMHRFLPLVLLVLLVAAFFSYTPFRRETVYKLGISGDTTTACCTEEDILASTGKFDENANVAIFNNNVIDYPKTSLAYNNLANTQPSDGSQVLGTKNAAGEDKWIEVSLEQQKLRAWEGDKIVMEFPISSGKWSPTPKGDFAIWYKTRNQSMKGGSKELGTYYNLANVPSNNFFTPQGHAIHGAYWHNNFGQPMSHGCVNAPLAQAAQLFEWTGPVLEPGKNVARATEDNPGTRVFVH